MAIEVSRSFRAMNTDVEAAVCVPPKMRAAGQRALRRLELPFANIEATLSRFRPGSELSRMNASAGSPFKASRLLFEVVTASLDAARSTQGLFDPTILHSLEAVGYDRSFEDVVIRDGASKATVPRPQCTWRDIRLDPGSLTISMPAGCGIDLGGIAKGWAVDQACRELKTFSGYAVDGGGDIVVCGTRADGSPWTIGVADPRNKDQDLLVLELGEGAVCTSSTAWRRWRFAGGWQHHLIDPRTGKPSESGVVAATVMAESAARAEVVAKAALLLGTKAGIRFLKEQQGIEGLLVLEDGRILSSAGFPEIRRVV